MKKYPLWVNFFRPASRYLQGRTAPIKEKSKKIYTKIAKILEKRPLMTFFFLLLILFISIAIGSFITKPKPQDEEKTKEPIVVETYSIGSAPKITVSAQIENNGVIQISAQTAGIVNKVSVKEGQSIQRAQTLISLSTNYQGANASSVQRQFASVQSQTAQITYLAQKDIITKQREIAEKTDANSDEIKNITQKSITDTKGLVTLNDSILSTLSTNLATLEANNIGGVNDALILQTKQLQSQFLSTTNQTKSSLRVSELQTDENKPPMQLSNLQKDAAIKQLDLQEKTLKLNVEASGLQVKLAQINESLMFPASPFAGTIEKVHVRLGQQVTPGVPLVTISSKGKTQTAVAYVPQNIAVGISKLNPSYLVVEDKKYEVIPSYISQVAVNGQLYAVIFAMPQEIGTTLPDKSFIDVEIPVGYSYTSSTVPFVPLDSVHQTQDKAVVFVIKDEKAEGKTVTLGKIQGNFIEITSGLEANDTIIVSRNITSGDFVKPKT